MSLSLFRVVAIILLIFLSLTGCASGATHLYRGEMELISVSGDACPEKGWANSHIPLELVLELESSFSGQRVTGYYSGQEIQTGHFLGNEITRLLVAYPDESGSAVQGHTLALSLTSDGLTGELQEKPPVTPSGCYFEKAVLKLKHAATGSEARTVFDHQRKLFSAEELSIRGHALLKANNPEEALRDLTASRKLHNEVDPNSPNDVEHTFPIAIAHAMAGRENDALAIVNDLLKEKPGSETNLLKQRMAVSSALCAYTVEPGGDAQQKASGKLMDAVAGAFGTHTGVGAVLVECYRELGQDRLEEGEPDQSLEFFRKALMLNPNDTDSIAGIVIAHIAMDTPAEGRRYLQEHATIVMDRAGRNSYSSSLSYLYAAEAKQAEKERNYVHAEQLLREAVTVFPGVREHIIGLARILAKAGKSGEAHKLLDDAERGCRDETCHREYSEERARQAQIERIVQHLRRE